MDRPSPNFFEGISYDLHCGETGRHKARIARQKWFDNICDRAMLSLIEKQKEVQAKDKDALEIAVEQDLQFHIKLQETVCVTDLHCALVNDIRKGVTDDLHNSR